MTNKLHILFTSLMLFSLTSCGNMGNGESNKNLQSEKAQDAANSVHFTANAEIDNIKKRLELTSNPGLLGYVILLNQTGQPVMYTAVQGKITSGGKRLTSTDVRDCPYEHCFTRAAPSDEGTYGSSGEYIYFWTPAGQYIQWNGGYLYSDKPFRLDIQPLVLQQEPIPLKKP